MFPPSGHSPFLRLLSPLPITPHPPSRRRYWSSPTPSSTPPREGSISISQGQLSHAEGPARTSGDTGPDRSHTCCPPRASGPGCRPTGWRGEGVDYSARGIYSAASWPIVTGCIAVLIHKDWRAFGCHGRRCDSRRLVRFTRRASLTESSSAQEKAEGTGALLFPTPSLLQAERGGPHREKGKTDERGRRGRGWRRRGEGGRKGMEGEREPC